MLHQKIKNMENQINEQQSMDIIAQMIQRSRHRLSESSFDLLLWGWLAFSAATFQYILYQYETTVEFSWFTWPVIMTIGGITAGIMGNRRIKEKGHESQIDFYMKYIWLGFIVMLFIILIHAPKLGWTGCYTMIIALYGLGIFSSGAILKYKPMMLAGAAAWVLSAIGVFVPFFHQSLENTLLLLASSIVVAYLIPGYMLKKSPDYV